MCLFLASVSFTKVLSAWPGIHTRTHIHPAYAASLAGSCLLVGATVPRDSLTVKKLRDAGAVILGKANMAQWASYRSRGIGLHGWSADGGQTLGAYHERQSPSGSSSGSAVAVDLGLAWAALGTETDGSIVFPAHRSGIVGIKPSVGLTSRDLVIPISERHDTVGPMARTVRDAARLLQVIAGPDPHDRYTDEIPWTLLPDYVAACDVDALQGARIGVPWELIQQLVNDEKVGFEIEVFKHAVTQLEQAGAIIVEANFITNKDDLHLAQQPVFRADFKANLASYLAQLTFNPSEINTLADVCDKTRQHPSEGFPDRNTAVWEEILFEQVWDNTDETHFPPAYAKLLELAGPLGLPGALDTHGLIAMVMPTCQASRWASSAGSPIVTVPLGHHPATAASVRVIKEDKEGLLLSLPSSDLVETGPGVPFGISFLGRKWSEAELIGLAYGFEQRTKVRERLVKRVVQPDTELGEVKAG